MADESDEKNWDTKPFKNGWTAPRGVVCSRPCLDVDVFRQPAGWRRHRRKFLPERWQARPVGMLKPAFTIPPPDVSGSVPGSWDVSLGNIFDNVLDAV